MTNDRSRHSHIFWSVGSALCYPAKTLQRIWYRASVSRESQMMLSVPTLATGVFVVGALVSSCHPVHGIVPHRSDSEEWQAVVSKIVSQIEQGSQVSTASGERETEAPLQLPKAAGIGFLSGVLANNETWFKPFGDDIVVTANWVWEGCVCTNLVCGSMTSGAFFGARLIQPSLRGYSPLLSVNAHNDLLPCGTNWVVDIEDIQLHGCNKLSDSNGTINFIAVEECEDDDVASMRLLDQEGTLVARAVGNDEMVPANGYGLNGTIVLGEIVDMFLTAFDLRPDGDDAQIYYLIKGSIEGVLDLFSTIQLGEPLSTATLAEVLRIFYYYSIVRLVLSVRRNQKLCHIMLCYVVLEEVRPCEADISAPAERESCVLPRIYLPRY